MVMYICGMFTPYTGCDTIGWFVCHLWLFVVVVEMRENSLRDAEERIRRLSTNNESKVEKYVWVTIYGYESIHSGTRL